MNILSIIGHICNVIRLIFQIYTYIKSKKDKK